MRASTSFTLSQWIGTYTTASGSPATTALVRCSLEAPAATSEQKAVILAESFQPGVSVSEVAHRRGVNRGLF